MTLPSRLLNTTCIITRPSKTANDIGDVAGSTTTVGSAIPCRVTRHDFNDEETITEAGIRSVSTHKMFMNSGVDILAGDYLTVGSNKYYVNDVNTEPGGLTNHHIEVLCSIVK